jgi:hypothetical protein
LAATVHPLGEPIVPTRLGRWIMADNPYESPECSIGQGETGLFNSTLSWLRAGTILAWLILGAPIGWAASTLLWRAGYLNPYYDWMGTFLVMVSPMILTAVFGARHSHAVIRRLVVIPLLVTSLLWCLAPVPSMTPHGISNLYANSYYPYVIVPGAVVGGVVAVLSFKLRSKTPQV